MNEPFHRGALPCAALAAAGAALLMLASCAGLGGAKVPSEGAAAKATLESRYRLAAVEPVTVANPRLLDDGPEVREEMLRLVRGARDHILVGSFLLNDGPESRPVLEALAERASAGVKVRVIGDTSSRYVMEDEAFTCLAESGVAAAEFNPVRAWQLLYLPALLERDHRKFWVVDGRGVFLGGANLSDSSLAPPEEGGNLDFMLRFDSPETAAALTRSFVETWNRSRAPFPIAREDFRPFSDGRAMAGRRGRFWIFDQTEVRANPSLTEVMLKGLYAEAERSVWLLEPYTFTHPSILRDIRGLSARGVEVNVVLSEKVRAPRFHYASHYGMLDLIRAGARVWIYDSPTTPLHYKGALVDDRLAFVGSSNLNLRSFRLSLELNAVFDDPGTVKAVRGIVDRIRRGCREVTAKEAKGYRSPKFATWWLVMQVAG
jgi:cardiolipin synthase